MLTICKHYIHNRNAMYLSNINTLIACSYDLLSLTVAGSNILEHNNSSSSNTTAQGIPASGVTRFLLGLKISCPQLLLLATDQVAGG